MTLFGPTLFGAPSDTTIETALASFVESVSGLKLYPILVPQNATLPAISYQVIRDDQVLYHGSQSNFYKAQIQLSVVCANYEQAVNLRNVLRNALDGYTGNMAGIKQVFRCSTSMSDDWAELHELPAARLDVSISYR